MPETNLGKLESVHGIAPAYLQRAVIVAVLSFVFFMAMLVAFSLRRNLGYFLLSTAFLIVYLFTMFGWLTLRKNVLKIYENGLSYKKFTARWNEIETVQAQSDGKQKFRAEIKKQNGESVVLNEAIQDVEQIVKGIKEEISREQTRTNTKKRTKLNS